MADVCPNCDREYIKRNNQTDAGVAWDYTYVHEVDTSGSVPEVTDDCRVTEDN